MTKEQELIKRCMKRGRTVKEEFEFEKEVHDYLKSDAPEEEKTKLRYYTEAVEMACSGLRMLLAEGKIKETDIL